MKAINYLINLVIYLLLPFAFAFIFSLLFCTTYISIVQSVGFAAFYFFYTVFALIGAGFKETHLI